MLVSVIMSVHNGEEFIESAIQCILNQTLKDLEFIIVNDGSYDGTLNIIKKYASKDKRIKLFNNRTNIGLTRSLNKIIKFCTGKFIARQDVDDISLPNRLETQISFLQKNPNYAFCGCNGIRKQNQSHEIIIFFEMEEIKENLIAENCFVHPSIVIRTKFLKKYGFFDETYLYGQDYELWCRLIYKYQLKAKNLKENLLIMNIPGKKFSKNKKKKFLTQRINSIRTQLKYFKYTPYSFKVIISIIIRLTEIFIFTHVMGYFIGFLKKIHF